MHVASHAALLSGEHPDLPHAELEALLSVHAPGATQAGGGEIALLDHPDAAALASALGRAALVQAWGRLVCAVDAGDLATAVKCVANQSYAGTWAVDAQRRGGASGPSSTEIERALGQALRDAGAHIDLDHPDRVLAAWSTPRLLVVAVAEAQIREQAFQARSPETRGHFSPVSLPPRRAASLLHLARVPPGGRVYDPFCGTGAFVLEAALHGFDAWGSDVDPWMVQGSLTTLADAGPRPLPGTVFQCDIQDAPDLVDHVDGIVTDLPYGRASSSHSEPLALLYERTLASFARLLRPGARAVVGHAEPALLASADAYGFVAEATYAERVHKSLTRHYAVLVRKHPLRPTAASDP